jgi:Novel STAND NTPase 1
MTDTTASPAAERMRRSRQRRRDGFRSLRIELHATEVEALVDAGFLVATVRADFYDPLISNPNVRALLPTQQVLLGAMSRAELESTIVEPAKLAGLTFDPPQLVSRILDEAGEDEGMLPLLQYALKETWELRDGNVITAESYARSGGVREAIRRMRSLARCSRPTARASSLRLGTARRGCGTGTASLSPSLRGIPALS